MHTIGIESHVYASLEGRRPENRRPCILRGSRYGFACMRLIIKMREQLRMTDWSLMIGGRKR
jgi:hypothetical protein